VHDGSPLPRSTLTIFALPGIASRAIGFTVMLYLPAMYAEDFGVGLTAVGLVFGAIRFVDMAWDPAIAILLDRTRTRLGKRRPWLAASTPVLLLAIVLAYMPGIVVGERATPLYLFITLGFLYVGQTFYELTHTAWAAELSTDYHERSRIQAFREAIAMAGGLAVLAIPIFYERFIDAEAVAPRVAAIGWFCVIAVPLSAAATVLLVPERRVTPPERTGFMAALRLLLSNPHLLRLAAIDALFWLYAGVSAALVVFFVKYWIEVPEGTTLVILLTQVASLLSIPLWARLSRGRGKHRAIAAAFTLSLAVHALYPAIGPGDIVLYWTLSVLSGLGSAAVMFLLRSMTADVVDYDNWKSGQERTALFFAVLSTTTRIAPSLAIGVTLPVLAFLGFHPAAGTPDAGAIQALRWVYIAIPLFTLGLAVCLLPGFGLDESQQRDLRQRIERRDGASRPPPPLSPAG
jgi:Na+/melibiose symporter-like transporter